MGTSGVSIATSTEFIQLKNMLRDVEIDTMMLPGHVVFAAVLYSNCWSTLR